MTLTSWVGRDVRRLITWNKTIQQFNTRTSQRQDMTYFTWTHSTLTYKARNLNSPLQNYSNHLVLAEIISASICIAVGRLYWIEPTANTFPPVKLPKTLRIDMFTLQRYNREATWKSSPSMWTDYSPPRWYRVQQKQITKLWISEWLCR